MTRQGVAIPSTAAPRRGGRVDEINHLESCFETAVTFRTFPGTSPKPMLQNLRWESWGIQTPDAGFAQDVESLSKNFAPMRKARQNYRPFGPTCVHSVRWLAI